MLRFPKKSSKQKKTTEIKKKTNLTGYIAKYARLVSSADKGAVIE